MDFMRLDAADALQDSDCDGVYSMRFHRLSCVMMSSLLLAVEPPWTETFTMPVAGSERTVAVRPEGTYLLLTDAEMSDPALVLGSKEIGVEAKLARTAGGLRLQRHPWIQVEGTALDAVAWVEGDNLWLFGSLAASSTSAGTFAVRAAKLAPSDQQRIEDRLAGIGRTDWNARLNAITWVREQGSIQPNAVFWLAQADALTAILVDDAAVEAARTGEVPLLDQAVSWCVDHLKDVRRAGRVASTAWWRKPGVAGGEELERRLRRLSLELYREEWRPRGEALQMEFDERFNALPWRDAEGFYRLGRWVDVNAEWLPRSKDLIHRCYQAGLRGDPNHPGIRASLGLAPSVAATGPSEDRWTHAKSGIQASAPAGWRRGERVEGEITWVDPASDTSYIAVGLGETPDHPTLDVVWNAEVAGLAVRSGFSPLLDEALEHPSYPARILRWNADGRSGVVALILNATAKTSVRLSAACDPGDLDRVAQAVSTVAQSVVIPDQAPGTP